MPVILTRSVRRLGLVPLVVALLVVPAARPGSTAPLDLGTARPFPEPVGSCFHLPPGPIAMAPNQLAAIYGVAPLWEAGFKGQGHSLAILDPGQIPNPTEVTKFKECFGIDTPVTLKPTPTQPSPPPGLNEATLDVEVALAAAPELDHVYVFTTAEGTGPNPLLQLLDAALDPANTGGKRVDAVSTSFSGCEQKLIAGTEPNYDTNYIGEMSAVLERAAALGVTVFADASDSGSSSCLTHPVAEVNATSQASVAFPGSSPWAVSVGGTQLSTTKDDDGSGQVHVERVWNEFAPAPGCPPGDLTSRVAGGGGVSTLFDAPPWQRGFAPSASRAVPDITALAGSPFYSGADNCSYWFGTSAATPYSAASWLVVLSALDAEGIASPGFLGPILYQLARSDYGGVYRDVTFGNNDIWDEVGCCNATAGFDEASGLGSLRFDALYRSLARARAAANAAPDADANATAPRFTG